MRRTFSTVVGVTGLVIVTGFAAYAEAAPTGPRTRPLAETLKGANITQRLFAHGSSVESVYKITSSLDGTGASIQHATITGTGFPLRGKGTTTTYFANGVATAKSTFKIGALDANGIATITGSGRCISGTRVHKNEKCTFTVTGTYNSKTTVTAVRITGTDTR
jgi:hypothetical protein